MGRSYACQQSVRFRCDSTLNTSPRARGSGGPGPLDRDNDKLIAARTQYTLPFDHELAPCARSCIVFASTRSNLRESTRQTLTHPILDAKLVVWLGAHHSSSEDSWDFQKVQVCRIPTVRVQHFEPPSSFL